MAQDEETDNNGDATGENGVKGLRGTKEKGDARRQKKQHSGPTRPGAPKRNPVNTSGHAGSDKSLHDDHPTS